MVPVSQVQALVLRALVPLTSKEESCSNKMELLTMATTKAKLKRRESGRGRSLFLLRLLQEVTPVIEGHTLVAICLTTTTTDSWKACIPKERTLTAASATRTVSTTGMMSTMFETTFLMDPVLKDHLRPPVILQSLRILRLLGNNRILWFIKALQEDNSSPAREILCSRAIIVCRRPAKLEAWGRYDFKLLIIVCQIWQPC